MKNILLTGVNGNIGRNLYKHLSKKSFNISFLSRKKMNHKRIIFCDYENNEIPKDCCLNIDVVVHLAAYSSDVGKFNLKDKKKYLNFNHHKTIELGKISILQKTKKFIFISSSKAINHGQIKNEDEINDYGSLKRYTEIKLIELFDKTDVELNILRFPLVYGPSINNNLNLLRTAIKFNIFPKILEINNKKQLIHIDDVVQSIYLAIRSNNFQETVLYITDQNIYSINKIQKIFRELEGNKVPAIPLPLIIFKLMARVNSHFDLYFKKIFEDDYHSDDISIFSRDYKPKTLKNIDETNI